MATTTTTGAMTTSTGCGTAAQYEIPVKDASCAVPNTDKYRGLLSKCAKPAGVTAYDDDCAIYALAVDQSVQDLTDCLYKAGVAWKDVWCHGDTNATATATSYPTASETSSTSSADKTSSGTSTESAATSTSTSGADVSFPKAHTSLKAVMLLSTLFASVLFIGI
ncbi:hypothetical protein N7489_009861 [Penicillium chrysogenum]|jgi:hypothetical protein|uniref:Uncharacterized protein n=1 Tax=Penicillium chrysogenum TaxID=5076 RepID=A0ABQ8WW59_PENCH|nr:uncharacterized protein N7489_009861 [Penicillium chrysogenum]KAJ5229153.1 hypothetical protein N7489_009861 [Penicillium chrysogenum]KAJ5258554.1 hypothetical protein N7524_010110 [Penicillium chrysogenum]KAJ5282967.1 hypothetical protein N7505_000947 [Penicillium chrysogenum]KAJ6169026.1 hypothetical protein N7497_001869 [Penicillium chrysogenum]